MASSGPPADLVTQFGKANDFRVFNHAAMGFVLEGVLNIQMLLFANARIVEAFQIALYKPLRDYLQHSTLNNTG